MNRLRATNSVAYAARDVTPGNAGGNPQYATNGNPATNVPATVFPAYWVNMVQDELLAVLAAANVTPDDTNWGQLLAAIQALAVNITKQANTWTALQTFNAGISASAITSSGPVSTAGVSSSQGELVTGFDTGGLNWRTTYGGVVGVGFRSDGNNFFLLSTPGGSPNGAYNNYRPLTYNLSSGALTLDTQGSGISAGGAFTAAGNVAGSRVYQSVGVRSTGSQQCVGYSDYTLAAPGAEIGYQIFPNLFTIAWTLTNISAGPTPISNFVTLPLTFPRGMFWCGAMFPGNTPAVGSTLAATPTNNSTVTVTAAAQNSGTVGCTVIAFGY